MSTFARTGGIQAVAGQGLVDVQAHQGNIHLTASDSIMLTAGVKVVIQAPDVQVISQGAQTQWGGGSIVEQASSAFVVKCANFAQTSGGGGVPVGVNMPTSTLNTDERGRLTRAGTREPLPGQRYTAFSVDGSQLGSGITDAQGFTEAFVGISIDNVRIVVHPEEGNQP